MSWKGSNYITGSRPTNIRPLTNKDPTNDYPSKFGLPRPMKHYRKGSMENRQVRSSNRVYQEYPGNATTTSRENPSAIPVVFNCMPIVSLTEKPQGNTCNGTLCCNAERKALKRVLPTSTKLSKQYYQTSAAYLKNRCKTFEQHEYKDNHDPKCCVVYKPNNRQYATQGAVSSGERLLRLSVNTVSKDVAMRKKRNDNAFPESESEPAPDLGPAISSYPFP